MRKQFNPISESARPDPSMLSAGEILLQLQAEVQSCESIRKMTTAELLELVRSTRVELDLPDLDLLHQFYAGWLDSELSEGLDRRTRSNVYHTYTIIRDLLTGILLLTDASTFNLEIKKGELKEKKEISNATFDVD